MKHRRKKYKIKIISSTPAMSEAELQQLKTDLLLNPMVTIEDKVKIIATRKKRLPRVLNNINRSINYK